MYGLGKLEEQRDVFLILAKTGYLDDDFAQQMGEMVSFPNRIVHMYWSADLRRLYRYLQEDVPLLERFRTFALYSPACKSVHQNRMAFSTGWSRISAGKLGHGVLLCAGFLICMRHYIPAVSQGNWAIILYRASK